MRTPILAALLFASTACAHAQADGANFTPRYAATSDATDDAPDACLLDDDDTQTCPVMGAPQDQDVTRMTSLVESKNETLATSETPLIHPQNDVDDIDPQMVPVADDSVTP